MAGGSAVPVLSRAAADLATTTLPFTLRQAYPLLAAVSGGIGVLVVIYLVLIRVLRRGRT